jgi:hypothetical protein
MTRPTSSASRKRVGPGLMQAANEGAKEAGAPGSIGIRVELPFEQNVNPIVVSRALGHFEPTEHEDSTVTRRFSLGRIPDRGAYDRARERRKCQRCCGSSMRITSEFCCDRSKTMCRPSGVTSNVFNVPRFPSCDSSRVVLVLKSRSQKSRA